MKKRIMISGLLLAAAMVTGCAGKQSITAPQLQEPVGIQLDKTAAYIGEIYNVEYFDSAVVPSVEALSFQMDGVIEKVLFYPGMVVEEGDVLVELDVSNLESRAQTLEDELAHSQAESAYTDAIVQADIDLLELDLKQLKQENATDREIKLKENEIDRKKAELRQTQQLRELENQAKQEELEYLKQTLANDTLCAPFSGQILYSDELSAGMNVKAFDPIVYLAADGMYLRGEYIKPTLLQRADFVIAQIDDVQYAVVEKTEDGENLNSAFSSDIKESTFDFAQPEALEGKVQVGLYAAIFVYTDYVPDALLVPRGAVLTDAAGSYVYVDENGDRVRREVTLGKVTDSLAQITQGLQEGEVVYVK